MEQRATIVTHMWRWPHLMSLVGTKDNGPSQNDLMELFKKTIL